MLSCVALVVGCNKGKPYISSQELIDKFEDYSGREVIVRGFLARKEKKLYIYENEKASKLDSVMANSARIYLMKRGNTEIKEYCIDQNVVVYGTPKPFVGVLAISKVNEILYMKDDSTCLKSDA
ncbi:hypothetical protein [Microbulbifer rhizosphaerae]|uniref:Uncharacterized protein n=1 Tax=Microbulbifer rhizosphaerae TaxID=1562603 RepID=A0A7W4WG13_9GAMM|nr:hypothetical protein [Microbulbifer rhizosphaerae]MBB3063008.1 hypothetical protein [Microbulbifer rhizosphaerae]